eukprot:COSAG01_NODE_655_length_14476_cov_6.592265_11_plen_100_part_00
MSDGASSVPHQYLISTSLVPYGFIHLQPLDHLMQLLSACGALSLALHIDLCVRRAGVSAPPAAAITIVGRRRGDDNRWRRQLRVGCRRRLAGGGGGLAG